jgi:hypothetical protein
MVAGQKKVLVPWLEPHRFESGRPTNARRAKNIVNQYAGSGVQADAPEKLDHLAQI